MSWVIFLTLVTLVFEVQSQICGCGVPGQVLQGQIPQINPGLSSLAPGYPCNQPPINPVCPQPLLPQQPIIPGPQPIITTSQPIYQSLPVVTTPVVATTIIDNTVSNALANAIQLLIVSNLIENTMNCGQISPVVGPIIGLITPNDDCCYDTIELPNICQCEPIGFTVTEVCQPFAPTVTNYAPPCQTFAPMQQCFTDFGNPLVQGPVAAEVYFPSAIPAQLTCNFGYMPASVPCVSVNVEPLPMFDSCTSNIFGNGFFY